MLQREDIVGTLNAQGSDDRTVDVLDLSQIAVTDGPVGPETRDRIPKDEIIVDKILEIGCLGMLIDIFGDPLVYLDDRLPCSNRSAAVSGKLDVDR